MHHVVEGDVLLLSYLPSVGSDGLYLVSVCRLSLEGQRDTYTPRNRRNKSHTNKLDAKNWKMREGPWNSQQDGGLPGFLGSYLCQQTAIVSLSLVFVLFGKSFCLNTWNSIA